MENWKWPEDWKSSVFIPIFKKGDAKECETTGQLQLYPTQAKYYLK